MSIENFDAAFLYQATLANLRLLSGRPPVGVDALLFHNRSYGDYTNLYETAEDMFERGRVRFIAVTNNEGERWNSNVPFEANPGMTECIRLLIEEHGIPVGNVRVPTSKAFHTRQENDAFLELSIENSWRSAVILAQPHQLLRSMLGMVQTMELCGYQMDVYTVAPDHTPWLEIVRGNQGIEEKPRIEFIQDELERVHLRQSTGELATFDELFAYLEAREKGTERLMRNLPSNHGGLVI